VKTKSNYEQIPHSLIRTILISQKNILGEFESRCEIKEKGIEFDKPKNK
jgi:hypothetical protein